MFTFKKLSIKQLFILLLGVPICLLLCIETSYDTWRRMKSFDDHLHEHGKTVALALAPKLSHPLLQNNTNLIQKQLDNVIEAPDIRASRLYNHEKKLIAHTGPHLPLPPDAFSEHLSTTTDIIGHTWLLVPIWHLKPDIGPEIVGWTAIELDNSFITVKHYQLIAAALLKIIFQFSFLALILLMCYRYVFSGLLQVSGMLIKDGPEAKLKLKLKNAPYEVTKVLNILQQWQQQHQALQSKMTDKIEHANIELKKTIETIKMQNIELDIAHKEALSANRAKSEFLANMSHEIRTPMNGILGFTNILLKTKPNAEQRDYLNTIRQSGESLMKIINDILDLSKIEAGKLALSNARVDIRGCIEETLTLLAPQADQKKLELIPIFYHDVPNFVMADKVRIKQILTNLVGNAIKFSPEGSVVVRLMTEKFYDSTTVLKITVTDNGVGLTDDEKTQVFNAFYQADNKTHEGVNGTGLGLIICKKLVKEMRGQIGLESEPNKGSTFWFTFNCSLPQIANEKPEPVPHLVDKHLLICSPHPLVRLSLSHVFEFLNMSTFDIIDLDDPLLAKQEQLNAHDLLLIDASMINENNHSKVQKIAENSGISMAFLVNTNDKERLEQWFNTPFLTLPKPPCRTRYQEILGKFFGNEDANEKPDPQVLPEPVALDSNLTILLADDHPANLKLLNLLLTNLGASTATAENGQQAVLMAKENTFDIILMDIQMPVMNGTEATRLLRREQAYAHTPIIAITAHAMIGEREKLLAVGFSDYLTKPVDDTQLRKIIKRWANKKTPTPPPIITHDISHFNKTNSVYDWDYALKQAANNKTLAKELYMLLIKDLKLEYPKLKVALRKQDTKTLKNIIHKWHGGVCYSGAKQLKTVLNHLETLLKQEAVESFYEEVDKLHCALESLFKVSIEQTETIH